MILCILVISLCILREANDQCSIHKALIGLRIARQSDLNPCIFIVSGLDVLELHCSYLLSYNATSSILVA